MQTSYSLCVGRHSQAQNAAADRTILCVFIHSVASTLGVKPRLGGPVSQSAATTSSHSQARLQHAHLTGSNILNTLRNNPNSLFYSSSVTTALCWSLASVLNTSTVGCTRIILHELLARLHISTGTTYALATRQAYVHAWNDTLRQHDFAAFFPLYCP